MDDANFKSAVSDTINSLIRTFKSKQPSSVDIGLFTTAIKKELVALDIPIFNVYVSRYRDNVIVLEFPFCKSCEIQINPVEFGSDKMVAELYIDKKKIRSIKLSQLDNRYMTKVASALVDYFKRFLLLRNKFKN